MIARHAHKLLLLLVSGLFSVQTAFATPVAELADIEFWVGTGMQEAALVIDWQGDETADHALAWGYRWDGTATGEDMLLAILTADQRLYAKLGTNGGMGRAVVGIGYDLNNDLQFGLDDGTAFDSRGIAEGPNSDGAASNDPGDLYAEGWFFDGYWNYGWTNENPFADGDWQPGGGGISSRTLQDGSWDSLAFTPTFAGTAFARNPLAARPPLADANADFDGDGDVDGRDFLTWQRGYGLVGDAQRTDGDADGNGIVDSADLEHWSQQFGTPTGDFLRPALPIPEPVSFTCFLIFAVGHGMYRPPRQWTFNWRSS